MGVRYGVSRPKNRHVNGRIEIVHRMSPICATRRTGRFGLQGQVELNTSGSLRHAPLSASFPMSSKQLATAFNSCCRAGWIKLLTGTLLTASFIWKDRLIRFPHNFDYQPSHGFIPPLNLRSAVN